VNNEVELGLETFHDVIAESEEGGRDIAAEDFDFFVNPVFLKRLKDRATKDFVLKTLVGFFVRAGAYENEEPRNLRDAVKKKTGHDLSKKTCRAGEKNFSVSKCAEYAEFGSSTAH
jgi:hypothetical protein